MSYLIPCQDFEEGHHLVGSVRVGRLAGHEVDEGLEGDDAHPVWVHYAHDAGELVLTLKATEKNCETHSQRQAFFCPFVSINMCNLREFK